MRCLTLLIAVAVVAVVMDDGASGAPPAPRRPKLLLILLDGFRWDYVYRSGLKGFERLRMGGVQAEAMLPIFPTVTVPNLYTITTGLYAESHGMLFNYMHDDRLARNFVLSPTSGDYNVSAWWEEAEPIWITTSQASVRTNVYLWPGCEMSNRGRMTTFCLPYHHAFGVDEFSSHVDQIVRQFADDEADFGMIYYEDTDFLGHLFGPESKQLHQALEEVDSVIDRLLTSIQNITHKVNVMVMSDHGMTATDANSVTKHKVDEFIDRNDIELVMDAGPLVQVFPKDNQNSFNKVYDQLKSAEGYSVYTPDQIPDRFHLKQSTHRLPPILVVADNKHAMAALWMSKLQVPFNPLPIDVLNGNHGYETAGNPDMRGIFLAIGPDFKACYKAPPINNTDVYNLAMHLLQLAPRPNNGSWDSVKHMLTQQPPTYVTSSAPLSTAATPIAVLTFLAHTILNHVTVN